MKRMLSLMVVIMLTIVATGLPSAVFAADLDAPIDEPVIEEYQYVSKVKTSLSISGGKAYASLSTADKCRQTTKIEATMYLQKKSGKSWSNITSWSTTANSYSLSFSKSKGISKGTYRVKSVIKVYRGNKYENITDTSSSATY